MRKQEYFDMGIEAGLTPSQIEWVLCKILEVSREEFFKLREISSSYIYTAQMAFYKFRSGVPEEYTTWKTNFYGRNFVIDERVLIPRIETEVLVREVLRVMNKDKDIKNMVYADIWTGSSCIAVSIVEELYPLTFYSAYGVDISKDALELAEKNIATYSKTKIELREWSLLEPLFHEINLTSKYLCITANLPYIKDGDHRSMGTSTLIHEPNIALYWGRETGFELYKTLIRQCFQVKEIHKIKSIDLFIEIGFDQHGVSKECLEELGLSFEYFSDSATIQRVIHVWGF